MGKSLKEIKTGNKKRVSDCRKRFREAGGKILQIPLDKEGIERFNRLKKTLKKKSNGALMISMIDILEELAEQAKAKNKIIHVE